METLRHESEKSVLKARLSETETSTTTFMPGFHAYSKVKVAVTTLYWVKRSQTFHTTLNGYTLVETNIITEGNLNI